MKYEEALLAKEQLGYTEYMHNGSTPMKVYIVPNLQEDYHKFFDYIRTNKIDDTSVKLFSSDGEYRLFGICYINFDIIYDDLTKSININGKP